MLLKNDSFEHGRMTMQSANALGGTRFGSNFRLRLMEYLMDHSITTVQYINMACLPLLTVTGDDSFVQLQILRLARSRSPNPRLAQSVFHEVERRCQLKQQLKDSVGDTLTAHEVLEIINIMYQLDQSDREDIFTMCSQLAGNVASLPFLVRILSYRGISWSDIAPIYFSEDDPQTAGRHLHRLLVASNEQLHNLRLDQAQDRDTIIDKVQDLSFWHRLPAAKNTWLQSSLATVDKQQQARFSELCKPLFDQFDIEVAFSGMQRIYSTPSPDWLKTRNRYIQF